MADETRSPQTRDGTAKLKVSTRWIEGMAGRIPDLSGWPDYGTVPGNLPVSKRLSESVCLLMNHDASLEITSALGERLTALRQTIATAESCSGGLIAHQITNVSGSSGYFLGGVVVYSNAAKMDLLGVPGAALDEHGAVSEVVARHMAEGVRRRFQSDYGVGVTGIAGPTGGTAEKPVGLVYVAVATTEGTVVTRNVFPGSRTVVKEQTAEKALQMVMERIA